MVLVLWCCCFVALLFGCLDLLLVFGVGCGCRVWLMFADCVVLFALVFGN